MNSKIVSVIDRMAITDTIAVAASAYSTGICYIAETSASIYYWHTGNQLTNLMLAEDIKQAMARDHPNYEVNTGPARYYDAWCCEVILDSTPSTKYNTCIQHAETDNGQARAQ